MKWKQALSCSRAALAKEVSRVNMFITGLHMCVQAGGNVSGLLC